METGWLLAPTAPTNPRRRTMRYQFEEVALQRSKVCKCAKCGKRLNRSKRFYQTVSPFNKNANGYQKTRSEINAELRVEADQWEQQPEYCATCK
jgi:hypothetical protein